MRTPDLDATPPEDIVVSLQGVWKVFHQKQRSARLQDVFRNLAKAPTRRVEALRGVDLTVRRGEVVAYAGPNGAGKSTTVKLLSGLLAPDSGTVRALGLDPVRDRTRYVSRIGVMFGQRTELWWDQPVAASFDWKRVVWDVPRARYDRWWGLLTELLGLGEFFNSLARDLSLGQRMRADLAMALLPEPEILFLDEPTLGLDVLAKRDVLRFITEINRERGVTVMVTSHDMADLEALAGRVVMIHRGAIVDGDFLNLRRTHADRRRLILETAGEPPVLDGAQHLGSENGRHEYVFDGAATPIASLLAQAAHRPRSWTWKRTGRLSMR